MKKLDTQKSLKRGAVGYNSSKKHWYFGYKATIITDGAYLYLLYMTPANQHDLGILKKTTKNLLKNSVIAVL